MNIKPTSKKKKPTFLLIPLFCKIKYDGLSSLTWQLIPLANLLQSRNAHSIVRTHPHGSQWSCFGLLKGRWLRLGPAGGTLLYTPEKVCHIILACSVLHNIALVNGVPLMCRRCQDADLHLGKVSLLASVSSLHVWPQWARPPNQEYLRV